MTEPVRAPEYEHLNLDPSRASISMRGELKVKVVRGGPWYRRAFYALFIDSWKGGRPQ